MLGIVAIQGDRLDEGYLRQEAADLGVSDLLKRFSLIRLFVSKMQPILPDLVPTARPFAFALASKWTFNTDITDPDILRGQLQKMCERVAQSLQKQGA